MNVSVGFERAVFTLYANAPASREIWWDLGRILMMLELA
jgi:hypothetical protein